MLFRCEIRSKRVGTDTSGKRNRGARGVFGLPQTPQAFRATLLHQAHMRKRISGSEFRLRTMRTLDGIFRIIPFRWWREVERILKLRRPEDLVIGEAILVKSISDES